MLTLLKKPHMHGYEAINGTKRVEIVQAYEGQWCVFVFVDGLLQRGQTLYRSFNAAKRHARQCLGEE